MKKYSLRLLCLMLLLTAFCPLCGAEDVNLLENGSFEAVDEDGFPDGWYSDAYRMQEGFTLFSSSEEAPCDGERSVTIRNFSENDARFAQTVEVEPETLYRLSGWIRADVPDSGRGANLSVEGVYAFSESVYQTDGEWQYVETYGETGEEQTVLTVFVRLGGYSGESRGAASFDDIRLEKVDEVPGDGIAALWFPPESGSYPEDDFDPEDDGLTEQRPAWPYLTAASLLYLLAACLMLEWFTSDQDTLSARQPRIRAMLLTGLLASLALRCVCACFVEGYAVDVNCFTSWGSTMRSYGPGSFYAASGFCDYPPAYLWILGLNSAVARLLGGSAPVTRIVYRLIPALCDCLSALLLYRIAVKKGMPERQSAAFSLLFAFLPAAFLNSAAWGQMDSVLCLLILLIAYLAMERRWQVLMPVYMLAVLVKPQALMLGLLGLIALIAAFRKYPEDRRKMGIGVLAALACLLAAALPFQGSQAPDWLPALYGKTLSSYPYATVNTANFYYLLRGNWSPIGADADPAAPLCFAALFACLAVLIWRSDRKSPAARLWALAFALLSALQAVLLLTQASWGAVGTVAMAAAFLFVLPIYLKRSDAENLPLAGAVLFLLLYVFGVKMHERYLFPALFLFGMAFALRRDWRILLLMAVTGCTVFLNEGIVLDNSIRLGSQLGHLNEDTERLNQILSCINVLAALFGAWTFWGLCWKEEPVRKARVRTLEPQRGFGHESMQAPRWSRRDWILMLTVTAVYAVTAFCNAGSLKAPQNPWKSSDEREQVVFDLGEGTEPYRILYHAQVSYNDFSLSFSSDLKEWSDPYWAEMNQGECFRWKYVVPFSGSGSRTYSSQSMPTEFSARYVRLSAEQIGLILNEIIFRTAEGRVLPAAVIAQENANEASPLYSPAAALLDEQDTLTGEPGWYNGTYFDEIYHARTAYEHLHGMAPYETTHPPLGKLIMSLFVAVFGMTPFGWRFGGILAGVLMLPAMYLTARELTGKTRYAVAGTLLMALDTMHYTQTRIATIDSYPVLFIILAFFFMLRFLHTDPVTASLRRILPDLLGSGFFMGCAIASKWIGCYAGAGLALLYFWHCGRGIRIYGRQALKRTAVLCAWCVLFFVALPAAIYLVCYIPYFAYTKIRGIGSFLKLVVQAQVNMYQYHSKPGLGMDHPFYSPWYEWPLIERPMYYAMAPATVPEGYSSAIFCFGNPAVWIGGLFGLAYTVTAWAGRHIYRSSSRKGILHFGAVDASVTEAFVLIGFLAQFLPWVLVPRGTYIYHYFASIPFLCLAAVLLLRSCEKALPRVGRILLPAYLVFTGVLFIAFYPYASGVLTRVEWLDFMRHFLRIYY